MPSESLVATSSKSGVIIRSLLERYDDWGLSTAGMLIFMGVFILVLIQIFRRKNRTYFEKMRGLPLE